MYAQALMRSEILDQATCDVCYDELNGIVLPADDPAWAGELGQEAHPNCRFMLVPLFEGIDPVMDITPADELPTIIRHLQTLLPAATVAEREAVLAQLNGGDILRARKITLEDLEDIFDNEELIYRIFYEGGG